MKKNILVLITFIIGINGFPLFGDVAISSANNQSFERSLESSNCATITITDGASPIITKDMILAIRIPPHLNLAWETNNNTVSLGGTAAGKVNSDVSYAQVGTNSLGQPKHCVLLEVTENFAANDTLTIEDLAFVTCSLARDEGNLELDCGKTGQTNAVDDKVITVNGMYASADDAYYYLATTNEYLAGPRVTLSSAAAQSFPRGYDSEACATLTITDDPDNAGILNGSVIAVRVPSDMAIEWDPSKTSPSLGGKASGKVNATVDYSEDKRQLLISVTADFAAGDNLSIGGLAFINRLGAGCSYLELDYDHDGRTDVWDDKSITIMGMYASGDDAYYYLAATNAYLDGPKVTLSSATDQYLARGYAPVECAALTITDDENPGIKADWVIAIGIPSSLMVEWDTTVLNPRFEGTAVSKVAEAVAYSEDSRWLLISVTDDFASQDQLIISDLAFVNHLDQGISRLELDYDNDGKTDTWDDKTLAVVGFYESDSAKHGAYYSTHQMPGDKGLNPVGTVITIVYHDTVTDEP